MVQGQYVGQPKNLQNFLYFICLISTIYKTEKALYPSINGIGAIYVSAYLNNVLHKETLGEMENDERTKKHSQKF